MRQFSDTINWSKLLQFDVGTYYWHKSTTNTNLVISIIMLGLKTLLFIRDAI